MLKLLEQNIIDPGTDFHYAEHTSMKLIGGIPHCHDFYELFLIAEGKVVHRINGERVALEEGMLAFIRPDDVHAYEPVGDCGIRLINIAFPKRSVMPLLTYFGPGFAPDRLLKCSQPPLIRLGPAEKMTLLGKLNRLTAIASSRQEQMKTEGRLLLAELLIRHFTALPAAEPAIASAWLERLEREMSKPEHFTAGIGRLHQLSPCSPEHLCRIIRKRYGITPTEWINGFRIDYAANLLRYTDNGIADIAGESGFENLSHFYLLFKKKYGLTPAMYRKQHRRIAIP